MSQLRAKASRHPVEAAYRIRQLEAELRKAQEREERLRDAVVEERQARYAKMRVPSKRPDLYSKAVKRHEDAVRRLDAALETEGA